MNLDRYDTEGFYDELYGEGGTPKPAAALLIERLGTFSDGELERRQQAAELALLNMGITFNVYHDDAGTEKIMPFDIVPRIVAGDDWAFLDRGLKQRIEALNLFIDDIYHEQKIVKDGVVPEFVVQSSKGYMPSCQGFDPPKGIWCHITGTDMIRGGDGQFYVLEDNMRCPSGVSYMLENRQVLKRTLPQIFAAMPVRPVDDYPDRLLATLSYLAPDHIATPTVVVLTPGIYNSAYFEHAFLAQQMGVELVEGRDLVIVDSFVMMRTTQGLQRVDVIYRSIDDDFLDPQVFRADSQLGCAGLVGAYKAGKVTLSNAIGTGIADDKSIYPYVPKMVEFYLGEKPILQNVPTYVCREKDDLAYTLAHLSELVVKEVHGAGGYGMLVGPAATKAEVEAFRARLVANPGNYIAQPTLSLSTCPTYVEAGIAPRHIDLRPFVLSGSSVRMVPGGLTRVALKEGSLVVNSSQGGGTKDTWVLED